MTKYHHFQPEVRSDSDTEAEGLVDDGSGFLVSVPGKWKLSNIEKSRDAEVVHNGDVPSDSWGTESNTGVAIYIPANSYTNLFFRHEDTGKEFVFRARSP